MRRLVTGFVFLFAALAGTGDRSVLSAEFQGAQPSKPELVMQTGHLRSVEAIAISPTNRWVATGGTDGTVKIWDAETGRELRSLAGHTGAVKSVASSPDGKLIASGGVDGTMRVWEVVSGTEVAKSGQSGDTVDSLTFSPDGTRLATGGLGKIVFIRNASTGAEIGRFPGHTAAISALAFSPNGSLLASGSVDRSVKLWDIAKATEKKTLPGHTEKIRALRFSPNGEMLASGGNDKTVRLWRTADGRELKVDTSNGAEILALHFSSPSALVSFDSNRSKKIWDTSLKTPPPVAGPAPGEAENPVMAAAVSSDGTLFATGQGDGNAVLFDTARANPVAVMDNHTVGFYGVAFSSDRRWMAAASYDSTVKLWDIEMGESLAVKKGHTGRVTCVAFHPNNRRIVSGSADGTVKIWDTLSPAAIETLPINTSKGRHVLISTLAVSAKSKLLAVGGNDTRITVWNLDNITAGPRFLGDHGGDVTAVAISPDDRFLASASRDATIKLWDLASGNALHTFESGVMHTVAFSPDGKLLASGGDDGTIRIWEAESKRPLQTIAAHAGAIYSVTFARGSGQLASAGFDKMVRIWDPQTGRAIRPLAGHSGAVKSAAFTADGKWMASASEDGSIIAWTGDTGDNVATLLSIKEGNGWLVTSPEGFFDGSPGSGDQLLWRFERDTFNTKPVEVFFEEFFVPGLLADIFNNRKQPSRTSVSDKNRQQPELSLTVLEPDSDGKVSVKIDIISAPAGAKDLRLFRNGSLVKVWRGDVMTGKPIEARIAIVAGQNRLTAYAFNVDDVKSRDQTRIVVGPSSLERKGISYILAVGVNKYSHPVFGDLDLAVKDAEVFTDEYKGQQKSLGSAERVEPILVADEQATKANILGKLKELSAKVKPEDSLTIFFAGHGLAVEDRFYLIPYGGTGLTGQSELAKLIPNWISDVEIGEAVERIDAGHMLLVIDACNSGKALDIEEKRRGPMNSKGLAQLAYEKGMYILTASQAFQDAKEDVQLGNGYLTYALVVEGLSKRQADGNKDNQILLREWLDYATEQVPKIDRKDRDLGVKEEKVKRGIALGRRKAGEVPAKPQSPRVFYRRESESRPILVAKY